MLKHLVIAVALTALLSCGQNTPLAEYEPKSPQELALKNVLSDFQDGVNARNSKKVANLIHAKASIMLGRDRKKFSKEEYAKILPQRLAENPSIALGKPKMTVSDDNAEVKIYMARGDNNTLIIFNMRLENDKWRIQSWEY
ncbi:hypothetical protein QUF75_16520 [Desulfococcaceae bacterium HSG7]|nr:hypothetical protein [Desulfococcaceae bacterium HSG9]MDM8556328.1 hypothetical protein [Desulfococcaceae bacterium HSG7]